LHFALTDWKRTGQEIKLSGSRLYGSAVWSPDSQKIALGR